MYRYLEENRNSDARYSVNLSGWSPESEDGCGSRNENKKEDEVVAEVTLR